MGNILIKKTPAKINLTLDVTGKLENGYHTLSMYATNSLLKKLQMKQFFFQ